MEKGHPSSQLLEDRLHRIIYSDFPQCYDASVKFVIFTDSSVVLAIWEIIWEPYLTNKRNGETISFFFTWIQNNIFKPKLIYGWYSWFRSKHNIKTPETSVPSHPKTDLVSLPSYTIYGFYRTPSPQPNPNVKHTIPCYQEFYCYTTVIIGLSKNNSWKTYWTKS